MRAKTFLAATTLAVAVSSAQAALLTVNNQSFEADTFVDTGAGYSTNSATGWTSVSSGWGAYNSINNNFSGTTATITPPNPGNLPSPATGVNYAYLSGTSAFQQTLTDVYQPNTTYTLTVSIGNNKVEADGFVRFALRNSSGELAGLTVDASTLVTTDTFKDFSFVYVTGNTVTADPITIRFSKVSGGQNGVDNVRLDAVPEPAAIGIAGVVIGCLARRRLR